MLNDIASPNRGDVEDLASQDRREQTAPGSLPFARALERLATIEGVMRDSELNRCVPRNLERGESGRMPEAARRPAGCRAGNNAHR